MKKIIILTILVTITILMTNTASAHFGMTIPSDSMVMQGDNKAVTVNLSFSHPFEGVGMELPKPRQVVLFSGGKKQDLTEGLKQIKVMNHTAWQAVYQIKRPGAYTFLMEPEPYWEPAEDCYIVHYTKTVIAAFGDDEGWDKEIGLKTEIVPLSKPFGLYAGNVFQGIVKLNGKPVPYAEVEVEYYNEKKAYTAPTDYMVTQTVKADGNGIFTYAAPKAGWWGFAALNTSDRKINKDGEEKDIELGAVIWIKFHEMK